MKKRWRIGWIGTGVMGEPMAGHLLAAGHDVVVYTRSKDKVAALLERGATWADTPREAAEGADAAISMVGLPSDVESVHLGADGTLSASTPPRFIIDMTTSRPSLAVRLFDEAKMRSVGSIDAPVSGGDVGARSAALSIMIGGEASDVEACRALFELMGRQIVHQGGPGSGQHTKMVNQILVGATMMGVCEGLLYANAAGLNATKVIESVSGGAAGSWAISNLGPRVLAGNFEPGFYVEHFIKDLSIAVEEAERMQLELPALALAKKLYESVQSQGLGRKGTQALYLALCRLNGRGI
jgi:3-hydroxyisobutyrate dehydrogenase